MARLNTALAIPSLSGVIQMNENFFIFTSQGIINRSQIISVKASDFGKTEGEVEIEIALTNGGYLFLEKDEAFEFLSALSPAITIGYSELFESLKRYAIKS